MSTDDPVAVLHAELLGAARRLATPVERSTAPDGPVRARRVRGRRRWGVLAAVIGLAVPAAAVGTGALTRFSSEEVGVSPRYTLPSVDASKAGAPKRSAATEAHLAQATVQDARQAFGVLRRPADAEERRDDEVRTAARHASVGLVASAARVVGHAAGATVWLIPATGSLCLGLQRAGDGFAFSCTQSAYALTQGVSIGDDGGIVGLLPDGAEDVRITGADGITTALDRDADGLFTTLERPSTVTFGSPAGEQRLQLA
jgi:hypothetical protein